MIRIFVSILSFILFSSFAFAQTLQSPKEFLGYELGTRFTPHHRVVDYYQYLAKTSELIQLEVYGKTNEHRMLQIAYVSAAENLSNLENIRTNHLSNAGLTNAESNADKAIVWLSYNVHGNESSSTEASMKTIYELITDKKAWLTNTIVIIDPCVNPDGRDRYVNWYNQVASVPYNANQKALEHREPWRSGRPNHYLFDLNRDWAWATQVETRQRLKVYNKWLPHIHVDFHEQGINEPYYFAPAAEPFHEVITDWQRDFQTQIGKNHARYFDEEGWLYFTRERFDLFYPSYGDTYPTFNGAIGMTYEQAGHGMAGLGIINDEGDLLTLKDRIEHHHTTGLSTVEISSQNVDKLNTEFKKYFNTTDFTYQSYVLSGNAAHIEKLTKLLDRHEINYGFTSNATVKGLNYTNGKQQSSNVENALVVSTNQPKGTMVKVLFERNAQLSDSLTYDITAWSLPYAYGLETIASKTLVTTSNTKTTPKNNTISAAANAYVANWKSVKDAKFLSRLLQENIRVRFTEKPFVSNGKTFNSGSLIITKGDQKEVDLAAKVNRIANQIGVNLHSLSSGFSDNGVDLGSPDIKEIKMPKVAVLSEGGVSTLSFGETWYFFEQELGFPVTNISVDQLNAATLRSFHVIVMPNGRYGKTLDAKTMAVLKNWIQNGGKVIAISGAMQSFADKDGFGLTRKKNETSDEQTDLISYAKSERQRISGSITGAIFETNVDTTHPLAFGYDDTYFTLKLGSDAYDYLKKGYTVTYLENTNAVSGFAGHKATKQIENTLVFGEQRIGRGSVIYMVDNPLFRAFWENGKLFFANAVFLVNNNSYEL